jgi:hypothetical protein
MESVWMFADFSFDCDIVFALQGYSFCFIHCVGKFYRLVEI